MSKIIINSLPTVGYCRGEELYVDSNGNTYGFYVQKIFDANNINIGMEFLLRINGVKDIEAYIESLSFTDKENILCNSLLMASELNLCFGIEVSFFINADPNIIADKKVIKRIKKILRYQEQLSNNLVIEITEQEATNIDGLIKGIFALQQIGVTIAIDDLGVGDSSLNRIVTLSSDIVKIRFEDIFSFDISLLDGLAKKIVIEKIENQSEYNCVSHYLSKLTSCELLYQGFWLSKPMPILAVIELITF